MIEALKELADVTVYGENGMTITLPDGTEVSVVRGPHTYGGPQGYWEAWHRAQDRDPIGWLSDEDVVEFVRVRAGSFTRPPPCHSQIRQARDGQ